MINHCSAWTFILILFLYAFLTINFVSSDFSFGFLQEVPLKIDWTVEYSRCQIGHFWFLGLNRSELCNWYFRNVRTTNQLIKKIIARGFRFQITFFLLRCNLYMGFICQLSELMLLLLTSHVVLYWPLYIWSIQS